MIKRHIFTRQFVMWEEGPLEGRGFPDSTGCVAVPLGTRRYPDGLGGAEIEVFAHIPQWAPLEQARNDLLAHAAKCAWRRSPAIILAMRGGDVAKAWVMLPKGRA